MNANVAARVRRRLIVVIGVKILSSFKYSMLLVSRARNKPKLLFVVVFWTMMMMMMDFSKIIHLSSVKL